MIGLRLKQAREAVGLSQRELATACGVSAMAISKYERDLSVPSSQVLMALADALGVRAEYFFRTQQVEFEKLEFRKHSRLPKKQEKRVLADALEQMERWLALEELLPNEWVAPFQVPENVQQTVSTFEDIERAAQAVRAAWGLGREPIVDLIEVLEENGLKVLLSEHARASDFDGLAAEANGHTVVLVGEDLPGDRQRFNIAHELGHLVLDGRLEGELPKDEERACHRFAGAFLVPDEEVLNALGSKRSWIEPRELYLLKQQWGLSMGGWSYRAFDLGIIKRSTMDRFWRLMRKHGWNKTEPNPQYPPEKPRRFERLVYRALAEELIGDSRAAELLGIPVAELSRQRNLETNHGTDHQ